MYEQLKASKPRVRMNVREVWKVIEYRDGCVYKTRSLGLIVCRPDYQLLKNEPYQIGSASTKVTRQLT